jgi:hypothetical protein
MKNYANSEDLLGKTLSKIDKTDDTITFYCTNGDVYLMYHEQDCCESVMIDDIEGDLDDLIGSELLQAGESTNCADTFGRIKYPDSFTWTFYKFATIKGYVTIRWLGESNGYYSESVDFVKLDND